MVRHDEAGDHGFPEAPVRFDQPFVSASHRVLGEHNSGDARVQERLDDDADAGSGEQPDALAIGDGRVGVGRPPNAADGAWDVSRRMDVENGQVLASEACIGSVFIHSG